MPIINKCLVLALYDSLMDTLYLVEVFGLTNIFGCSLLEAASSKSLSLDQHLPFVKLKLQLDFINHVACKLLLTAQSKPI